MASIAVMPIPCHVEKSTKTSTSLSSIGICRGPSVPASLNGNPRGRSSHPACSGRTPKTTISTAGPWARAMASKTSIVSRGWRNGVAGRTMPAMRSGRAGHSGPGRGRGRNSAAS